MRSRILDLNQTKYGDWRLFVLVSSFYRIIFVFVSYTCAIDEVDYTQLLSPR